MNLILESNRNIPRVYLTYI